jgi:hypothetical protein
VVAWIAVSIVTLGSGIVAWIVYHFIIRDMLLPTVVVEAYPTEVSGGARPRGWSSEVPRLPPGVRGVPPYGGEGLGQRGIAPYTPSTRPTPYPGGAFFMHLLRRIGA